MSALAFALENWLRANPDEAEKVNESVLESGHVSISFAGGDRAETAFDVILVGLMSMELAHPGEIYTEYKKIV